MVMTAVGYNYRHPPAVQRANEFDPLGHRMPGGPRPQGIFLNDHASEPRGARGWRFRAR